MDLHNLYGFQGMDAKDGVIGPAALVETFPRFQGGFLTSEDFHRIPLIFINFF